MIVAALLVALGLLMGIVVTQARGLRMSGVLVVPLFAVYSLYDLYAFPLAVVSTAAAYLGLALLKRRTMLYGRVLLLSAIAIGAVVPIVGLAALSVLTGTDPVYAHLVFLGSVLPGVAAYNYHRLDRDRRIEDVGASLSAFVGLFVLGATVLNPTVAATLGRLTPTVLFASSADVATLRGAALADPALTATGVGFGASVALLLAGGAVSEAVYGRYGVRLNGLIAAPLLALFALQSPSVVPLYLVGTVAVFLVVRTINRRTLLYGRVLLSVAVLAGVVLAVPAAAFLPGVSGFVLLFLSILAGIGAYNFHRLAPAERSTGALLSAALFVVSLAVALPVARPLSGTMLAESLVVTVALSLLGVAVCALAGVRVTRFERERRRLTRRLTAEGVA
ncbi:poly-gamma-glutamate biosynthesis protein PgsC/CapC [Halomarina oriensis]|uniref:poly-gamma-glutamate biosynthesis protein PgsC/CapC n=1 Tax=Halomarina oriensis TaxID=671145 RepID=UPI0013037112